MIWACVGTVTPRRRADATGADKLRRRRALQQSSTRRPGEPTTRRPADERESGENEATAASANLREHYSSPASKASGRTVLGLDQSWPRRGELAARGAVTYLHVPVHGHGQIDARRRGLASQRGRKLAVQRRLRWVAAHVRLHERVHTYLRRPRLLPPSSVPRRNRLDRRHDDAQAGPDSTRLDSTKADGGPTVDNPADRRAHE
ncbi:hypothetical protein DCS_05387 [Drechmeria coniospora]|uniref:Uncharacterized protein n=1 Tax=Drechmeria coniospora TaxID=98403 RepID=A0A151GMM3_DRECN|nr:hypothetical protein DCS_05387 [Drechmeria coniospora]KYK58374.1 hypothetical protein DCS_05387 [Drechmeria coniospora]